MQINQEGERDATKSITNRELGKMGGVKAWSVCSQSSKVNDLKKNGKEVTVQEYKND